MKIFHVFMSFELCSGFILLILLFMNAAPGISASPSEDNMRYFNVMILGPTQSPYEGNICAIICELWSLLGCLLPVMR